MSRRHVLDILFVGHMTLTRFDRLMSIIRLHCRQVTVKRMWEAVAWCSGVHHVAATSLPTLAAYAYAANCKRFLFGLLLLFFVDFFFVDCFFIDFVFSTCALQPQSLSVCLAFMCGIWRSLASWNTLCCFVSIFCLFACLFLFVVIKTDLFL